VSLAIRSAAAQTSKGGVIVITGSIFVVGEAMGSLGMKI
jgi:folylpolyglutamate synthase/dihydropteroate synthase